LLKNPSAMSDCVHMALEQTSQQIISWKIVQRCTCRENLFSVWKYPSNCHHGKHTRQKITARNDAHTSTNTHRLLPTVSIKVMAFCSNIGIQRYMTKPFCKAKSHIGSTTRLPTAKHPTKLRKSETVKTPKVQNMQTHNIHSFIHSFISQWPHINTSSNYKITNYIKVFYTVSYNNGLERFLPCDAMHCAVLVIVILSVRPSVCHTRGLCAHGSR